MTWTCRKCKTKNTSRKRKCVCGKPRPIRKKPAHMQALELPYEVFVGINGGETCGVCGAVPAGKRLDRDHDHRTGLPRGLLCRRCNRLLTRRLEPLLTGMVNYIERHRHER